MRGFNLQQALAVMQRDELPLWTAARQTPEHAACGVGASRGVSRRRLSQHDWSSQ